MNRHVVALLSALLSTLVMMFWWGAGFVAILGACTGHPEPLVLGAIAYFASVYIDNLFLPDDPCDH
jgi:hypothetical protein